MNAFLNTFLIFFTAVAFAQNARSGDTAYLYVENQKFGDIKEYKTADFKFVNPTVNLENMVDIFMPQPYNFSPQKGSKTLKKITAYTKSGDQDTKKYHSEDFFDREGKKYQTNEFGYLSTNFKYDKLGRLSDKIRVVRADTVYHHRYRFNKNSQLISYGTTKIQYDSSGRPVSFKDSLAVDFPYRTVIMYDHSKVRIEEQKNGTAIGFREFTYSENLNLIKERYADRTVFHSYNAQNQKIKTVEFTGENLYRIQTFEYSEMGDLKKQRSHSGPNIKSGITTENVPTYRYDAQGNKTFFKSSSVVASPTEYFYENEYY
jgi:hypothetical protein